MFLKGAKLLSFRLLILLQCSVLVLWVHQVKEAVEIHCLEHSFTKTLADGLVLNIACAAFSFFQKRESDHTSGLASSPEYPSSQSTYTLCSPQVWAQCSSLKTGTSPT